MSDLASLIAALTADTITNVKGVASATLLGDGNLAGVPRGNPTSQSAVYVLGTNGDRVLIHVMGWRLSREDD